MTTTIGTRQIPITLLFTNPQHGYTAKQVPLAISLGQDRLPEVAKQIEDALAPYMLEQYRIQDGVANSIVRSLTERNYVIPCSQHSLVTTLAAAEPPFMSTAQALEARMALQNLGVRETPEEESKYTQLGDIKYIGALPGLRSPILTIIPEGDKKDLFRALLNPALKLEGSGQQRLLELHSERGQQEALKILADHNLITPSHAASLTAELAERRKNRITMDGNTPNVNRLYFDQSKQDVGRF